MTLVVDLALKITPIRFVLTTQFLACRQINKPSHLGYVFDWHLGVLFPVWGHSVQLIITDGENMFTTNLIKHIMYVQRY